MSPGCFFGRHRAPNAYFAQRNEEQGLTFGECPGCYETIVRPDRGRWQELPEGKRVAWTKGTPSLVDGRTRTSSSTQRGVLGAVRKTSRWVARRLGREKRLG